MVSGDQEPARQLSFQEVTFLCAAQVLKAELKRLCELMHLAQGGRVGISWFKGLTDLFLLASRTLYVTA